MVPIKSSAAPNDTSARESAVRSLINGGYAERQAREIVASVQGEAREDGYRRGAAAARNEIAADFIRQGKASNSLTWGQAHEIALNGLCSCSGGHKPCDMGGAA